MLTLAIYSRRLIMCAGYAFVGLAPIDQTRGGVAPLTEWSPTIRTLNTQGL